MPELNKEGRTKGRFGDHKADLVVSLRTDENESLMKEVLIVKGWEYALGAVGLFALDPRAARMRRADR